MYITNITNYDKLNDDHNDTISLKNDCTNSENKIEIVIPLFTIISCGMSLLCLLSFMINTLNKPLKRKK